MVICMWFDCCFELFNSVVGFYLLKCFHYCICANMLVCFG